MALVLSGDGTEAPLLWDALESSRSDQYPGLGCESGVEPYVSVVLSGQNTGELRAGNLITLLELSERRKCLIV